MMFAYLAVILGRITATMLGAVLRLLLYVALIPVRVLSDPRDRRLSCLWVLLLGGLILLAVSGS